MPGAEGIHHSRYFDVTYSINALGLRDGPRTIVKHLGTDRILLYGDSVIFGWGIPMVFTAHANGCAARGRSSRPLRR